MKRDRLDREIESIENDDFLTNEEKSRKIRELEKDYESAMRESCERAYDNEKENW